MAPSLTDLVGTIVDNKTGFGPSPDHLPPQFKDIPYAPFSKNDKLGRIVDWNQSEPSTSLAAGVSNRRTTQQNTLANAKHGREPKEAFGALNAGTFAYFHDEDEASFSLVDGKAAGAAVGANGIKRLGGNNNMNRGNQAGRSARGGRGVSAPGPVGRNAATAGRTIGKRVNVAGRQWKDWSKEPQRRDASITVGDDWTLLEEIEFPRLSKLRLQVNTDEPDTLSTHGFLYEYDKTYDRINTRAEKPLQNIERLRYNPTTSEDPVIQQLSARADYQIYVTDSILSLLMCASRTVYPWDIILTREGNKLFFDKREGGPFDYVSVNENANEAPVENANDHLNSPSALSLEATYINQIYAFQVMQEDTNTRIDMEQGNPFYFDGPSGDAPLASCAYRYRKFDLSISEEEDLQLIVRTQLDAYTKANPSSEPSYVTIKALNEFDSRAAGSGGALDWRTKLDGQRGAVIAMEMKNNSSKLARWAVQSILAGAEQMKIGYISRASPLSATKHTILGSQWYKPREFASQLNVNLANGWGIVRTIADLALKQKEGKYVLMKDPNKAIIQLYAVPLDAFDPNAEDIEDDQEDDLLSDDGL